MTGAVAPRFITAAALLATEIPEARFAVPGILPEGAALLVGRPKLGKSWLVLGLAIAKASGGVALGKVKVDASDVLYMALEDTPRRLQSRLRAMLGKVPAPARLTLTRDWPRLNQGGLDYVDTFLTEHPGALVIIDTYTKVRPVRQREGNLYDLESAEMGEVKKLADRHHVTILLVFHVRKAPADDWLDTVNASTGLAGAADSILLLRRERGQHDATLCVTGRDVEEQELALRWDPALSTWTLLGEATEFRVSEERAAAIATLREVSRPLTVAEVALALGKDKDTTRTMLWRMASAGQILSMGRGLYTSNNGNDGYVRNGRNDGNEGNGNVSHVSTVTDSRTPAH